MKPSEKDTEHASPIPASISSSCISDKHMFLAFAVLAGVQYSLHSGVIHVGKPFVME